MENEIFERMPIPKAYFKIALPVVIGMVVSLIYNLADHWLRKTSAEQSHRKDRIRNLGRHIIVHRRTGRADDQNRQEISAEGKIKCQQKR